MAKRNSIDKQRKQYTENQTAITTNHARQEVLAYMFLVFCCDDQQGLDKLLTEHILCGNSCCSNFCSFVGIVVFCFCSWIILLLEYHFRLVCSVFIYSLFVFRLGYSVFIYSLFVFRLVCSVFIYSLFVFRLGYSFFVFRLGYSFFVFRLGYSFFVFRLGYSFFVFRLGYSDLSSDLDTLSLSSDLDTLICFQTWIL